jgi:hypothetical protein
MDSFGARALLGDTGIGGGTKLSAPTDVVVLIDERRLMTEAEEVTSGCPPLLSR